MLRFVPEMRRAVLHLGDLRVRIGLARPMRVIDDTLKPGGVLFSSNPRGRNEEGWNSGRYGVYHDLESWSRYTSAAGFVEITHYYRPDGVPREQQPWLASVWRRWAP